MTAVTAPMMRVRFQLFRYFLHIMKSLVVGTEVEYKGILLRIEVASSPALCRGCYFSRRSVCRKDQEADWVVGSCLSVVRPDGQNVYFKKIGKVE